ncbi:MAG: hypothetical protein WC130_11475 [Kiritimatiellia bacterium]
MDIVARSFASGLVALLFGPPVATAGRGEPFAAVPAGEYFRLYRDDPQFTSRNEVWLAAPPNIHSFRHFADDLCLEHGDAFPLNRTLAYHDASGKCYLSTHAMIRGEFGWAGCLADYLWIGEALAAISYRAIFEAANKARPRNAGYCAMRTACAPLHAQVSLDDGSVQLVSTLDRELASLTVHIDGFTIDGMPDLHTEFAADAAPDATTHIGLLPDLARDGRFRIPRIRLLSNGELIEQSTNWFQASQHWGELLAAPPVRLEARDFDPSCEEGTCHMRIRLLNPTATPALLVTLTLVHRHDDREILPVFWSDNSTTLFGGESVEMHAEFRCKNPDAPALRIEGWNVLPTLISLAGKKSEEPSVRIETLEQLPDGSRVFSVTGGIVGCPHLFTVPLELRRNGQLVRTVRAEVGLREPARIVLPAAECGGVLVLSAGLAPEVPLSRITQ